jgi:glucose/arabinose dehydrogenase
MRNSVFLSFLYIILFNNSCAQNAENQISSSVNTPFSAVLLIDEIQVPWGMTFLPDGGILITEKSGELIHFVNGKKTTILNVPKVYNRGQGGLLDIELHPDYINNGWVYISYASSEGEEKGGHTALMRAKIENNALINKEVLYKAGPNTTKGQHFGSRIAFDDNGYLFLSIGERGSRDENPQDLSRDGGKIYRFHDDGSIPESNPFFGNSNAINAIFSYGHRNPQGLVKHPKTGEIWDHEHGPRGGDEINIIKPGANYGWPVITYGINYSGTEITDKKEMEGMEQPIHYWTPSIAPSGMTFITTDAYGSDWNGSLLVGSLAFQYLERLEMDGPKVIKREKLIDGLGRVRDVKEDPNGIIHVAVEGKGIYKLIPNK